MDISPEIQSGKKVFTENHEEKIEILSTDLLDDNRALVEELRQLARFLRLELGWHYLLDLVWIISNLGQVGGKRIIDAGAGTGLLQWYLAKKGASVISVDRESRAQLPVRFRVNYQVEGLRKEDLQPFKMININDGRFFKNLYKGSKNLTEYTKYRITGIFNRISHASDQGNVLIYNQDLSNMPDIGGGSVDAVVAVSALEHNSQEELVPVLKEIYRVVPQGGALIATLGAAKSVDWWHKPSNGWCYTEATLKEIFQFSGNIPSNYDQYDLLFDKLVHCAELRDNLAGFYFKSGNNGMPWGKWDPQYQPVGIVKLNRI